MRNYVYAANTSTQTVAPNGTINFGPVISRCGNLCDVVGGNITIEQGCYSIDGSITFTATAGTMVLTWYKNGAVIPGATSSRTTVADTIFTVDIGDFMVKDKCCCEDVITCVVTGVTATISNARVRVERL